MNIEELLDQCDYAYDYYDFKRLIELCDEFLKTDPDNQKATGYKSLACCFLNRPEETVEILTEALKLHPHNYHFKNSLAMAYYDLKEYEKSLKCCEEGILIKRLDWLFENKIKALLKLNRSDDAIECWQYSPPGIEITDLFLETEKYEDALKYCLEEEPDDFFPLIDKIKERDTGSVGDYYMTWIDCIKSKSDIRICSECGGRLLEIVWGYPDQYLLEKARCREIHLGGCRIPGNPPNYHCSKCGKNFNLGIEGFHIECDDYMLFEYTEYKIRELVLILNDKKPGDLKSPDELKGQLRGFDDREFDAFISRICELDSQFLKLHNSRKNEKNRKISQEIYDEVKKYRKKQKSNAE